MNRLRNAGCKKEKEGIKLRGNVKKKKEKKSGKSREKKKRKREEETPAG